MRWRNQATRAQRVDINMTPMIDVVFQLLAFFVMSFKIVSAEGDLTLKLPAETAQEVVTSRPFVPPLQVHLLAAGQGELAAIKLGDRPLRDLGELHREVQTIVAGDQEIANDLRVKMICDDALHYKHVVAALTAVSGERTAAGAILPLATNVQIQRPH